MEYNKDEAQRALEIAEAKIAVQELEAAKKFAGKAQQLYPSLEGLSQMNAVLDVYMAAEKKVNGQTDWYGILHVESGADEAVIKKQYRKLALLLHPDKNKCAGAEGAFKLIGEAWGVLSDKVKRSMYDHKRNFGLAQQFKIQKPQNNNGYDFSRQNADAGTFWTACPSCKMQYEYPRMYINHNLLCPTCGNPYMAFEVAGFNKNGVRPSAAPRGGAPGYPGGAPNPNVNVGAANAQKPSAPPRASNGAAKAKNGINTPKKKTEETTPKKKSQEKKGRRRKPRPDECDSDEVIHADEVSLSEDEGDGGKDDSEEVTEVSKPTRRKRDDSIKTNIKRQKADREDTTSKSSKRADRNDADADGNAEENDDEASRIAVPDPDFGDFDGERTPVCFKEGQIWAVYDDDDGMPRFYARIQKVISASSEENFEVKMNWLEALRKDNRAVGRWLDAGFYQACGDFKTGRALKSDALNTFSHVVVWDNGPKGIIRILPRKGEVWALYREWDSSWNESTPDEVKQKYEMVEISMGLDEEVGVGVTSLVKVDGFSCVFQRTEVVRSIPKSELLRISHQVPAKKLSGKEALNLPENCWELDPAATPLSR